MRREKHPGRSARPSQRPFSAARLAAEALFAGPAAAPAGRTDPAPAPAGAAPVAPPAHRPPKVHRIARQGTEGDAAPPDATPDATPAPPALDSAAGTAPAPRLRRRNTRQLHGEVLVIRPPNVADARAASAADVGADERRSVALQARLCVLEAEIEVARRRAAEAIRWIHAQMDAYGITLDELGPP